MARPDWKWLVCGVLLVGLGCGQNQPDGYGKGGNPSIKFQNKPKTNVQVSPEELELQFTNSKGNTVDLTEFRGKKNVVLVFMRGTSGGV